MFEFKNTTKKNTNYIQAGDNKKKKEKRRRQFAKQKKMSWNDAFEG